MHPSLSFDQAPPIGVPYRFLLTAPWFGVAAGLLLAVEGAEALGNRWAPQTLALTHLLTVGFMLQAMCGALLQFVPVAAGGNVWRPRLVGGIVHPALAAAAALLGFAFIDGRAAFFVSAALLLGTALAGYLVVVGWAVLRTPAQGHTIATLRFALLGLGVTAALGVTLALGMGGVAVLPLVELTNVHAAWGLGGWALLLLAGVSYFVVPMFQLTPPYPAWIARVLPAGLLGVLALWSFQVSGNAPSWWLATVILSGAGLAALYAGVTLDLQRRRRRKVTDTTFLFFRGAMVCLLVIFVSTAAFHLVPGLDDEPRIAVWIGVLAVVGVFVSAISGMLYKIVPFLNWLHLQRLGGLGVLPPNMNQMISEPAMRGQMRLHFSALAALLAAVWMPALARPAGLLFAASCGWLGWNLVGAVRIYRTFRDRILADGARR